MAHLPNPQRYDSMVYRQCGRSGLRLPVLSLGLWHSFGDGTPMETQQAIVRAAFGTVKPPAARARARRTGRRSKARRSR